MLFLHHEFCFLHSSPHLVLPVDPLAQSPKDHKRPFACRAMLSRPGAPDSRGPVPVGYTCARLYLVPFGTRVDTLSTEVKTGHLFVKFTVRKLLISDHPSPMTRHLIVFVLIVAVRHTNCLEQPSDQVNSSISDVNSRSEPVRPIYNIAHMANSIREIKYFLSKGANAIETDVTFSSNGTALSTFHGYPCDCFRHCNQREDFVEYLKYVRTLTLPGELDNLISVQTFNNQHFQFVQRVKTSKPPWL